MATENLQDADVGIILWIISALLVIGGAITFYSFSWIFGIIVVGFGFVLCVYGLLFTKMRTKILPKTKK